MSEAQVRSRDQLIGHIFHLMDDFDGAGDHWQNQDIYTFLQAMAAWLNDCEGYYRNVGQAVDVERASWQLLADAFSAGAVYQ
jgi:hypothetical protein